MATSSSSRPVTVVTDSTADIPRSLADSFGIQVIPLTVRFGNESFLDGIELGPNEFLARLTESKQLPKTSQPSSLAFESVFTTALDEGHDVVCITLSANLSGSYNSARLAADAVGSDRVHVIDSGTVSMHLGWAAVSAATAAREGHATDTVIDSARSAIDRGRLYALLETLEYVYRGGRIGKASQLVGSVLAIKPILTVRDGVVTPVERIRTWRKALERIVELGRTHAPLASLAVLHAGNPSDAAQVADRLSDLVPADQIVIGQAGPVITTYAGPGAVGVFPLTRRDS